MHRTGCVFCKRAYPVAVCGEIWIFQGESTVFTCGPHMMRTTAKPPDRTPIPVPWSAPEFGGALYRDAVEVLTHAERSPWHVCNALMAALMPHASGRAWSRQGCVRTAQNTHASARARRAGERAGARKQSRRDAHECADVCVGGYMQAVVTAF